jgi:hypothetical protein
LGNLTNHLFLTTNMTLVYFFNFLDLISFIFKKKVELL